MRFVSCPVGVVLLVCWPALLRPAAAQPAAPAEQPPSPVKVSAVVQREVETFQSGVGTVQPVRRSIVGSAVDGRVIAFPVENGDRVSAGDMLAQLRTETLEWQMAASKAELRHREQDLAELKNGT
ncbi:MAG: biotin/lipoyl-binding protein, partial [Planctomycetaceae bacterium]